MIKVSNLNKYYNKNKDNEIHVINDCNLVLPNQGFVVFLGASGSGKTTLINVIAGLDKAKGEISYDEATFKNYKMDKVDKFRRDNIGYVFQNYNLLNNLTVYENLREVLELMGITNESEIDSRIDYVLDILGIKKYKNKLASNLSGGQMQRVSIARALAKDSKIIIADEPTGNLDSENTIAVMNILKAISKDRLVLMVTHDRKNASFYADRIIEIKDGKVENDYDNQSENELDNFDKTKIYLKDLKHDVLDLGNIKVNLYLDEGESIDNLDLTIVKKNGSIYLQNETVKFVDKESKIKLIDDNYKTIKKEDIESIKFEPTPFSEQKKKFSFKPFLNGLANAYRTHKQSSKRMKGLHACFVIIGVVMAVCVLMLSVGTYVKPNKIDYSDIGLTFKKANVSEFADAIDKGINEGLIVDFTDKSNLIYSSSIAGNVFLTNVVYPLHNKYINDTKVAGDLTINKDEVVITTRIADEIIKKMSNIDNLSYSSLIGEKVKLGNGDSKEYTIKGIVRSNSTTFYYEGDPNFAGGIDDFDYIRANRYYEYSQSIPSMEYASNFDYELISGRPISSDNECLVSFSKYTENYLNSDEVIINGTHLNIVGIYISKDSDASSPSILVNDGSELPNLYIGTINGTSNIRAKGLELASGRMPIEKDEVLVSEHYVKGKNSDIDKLIEKNDYKIVGTFKSDFSYINNCVALTDEAMLYSALKYPSRGYTIISSNDSETIKLFEEKGTQLKTSYDYNHDLQVKQKREMFGSALTVSMVFLTIIVIYTFFMMRSKMIHRIYEIGVLREIGASRFKIYKIFFVELLVLIFMTTMIGYLGSLALCFLANKKIKGLIGIFNYSPLYALGGFVVLLVVSLIAGMLPIFTLQRKTPAEIVAKYDL